MIQGKLIQRALRLSASLVLILSITSSSDEAHKEAFNAYKAGKYERAISMFKSAIEENPEWFYCHYMLGRTYKADKQFEKACESYKSAGDFADTTDRKFNALYELADCCFKTRRYSDALSYAKSAFQHRNAANYQKAYENMLLIMGFCNYRLSKFQDTINTLRPLVDLGRDDMNILLVMAQSYAKTGQIEMASSIANMLVRKHPDNLNAHKLKIYIEIENKNWSQAVAAADNAAGQFSNNMDLLYLKGLAEYKAGRLDSALSSLNKALTVKSGHKVHRLIGDIHSTIGNWISAIKHYNKAQKGGDYYDNPDFFIRFAYCWSRFAPEETEKYGESAKAELYKQSLENAKVLLIHAGSLEGADSTLVYRFLQNVENRIKRLEGDTAAQDQTIITLDRGKDRIVAKRNR